MAVITCIEDLRVLAKRRVPRMFYDYADAGSWTESTYRANEADFPPIKLRQRVAVDIEHRSVRADDGRRQRDEMPVALAPVGLTGMQHADGEILAARAAEKFGVPFTLSTMSICSIEDVAAATGMPFWFQLYVVRDRDFTGRIIDRAKAAGCGALVLTLDLQILGQRHMDIKNGLSIAAQADARATSSTSRPSRAGASACSARAPFVRQHRRPREGRGQTCGSLAEWIARAVRPAPQLGRRRVDQEVAGAAS